MIQPIKGFQVTALTVQGFKGYEKAQSFTFGDLNMITGHMGVGKSSIADAIAFAITGTSFFGAGRLDFLYNRGIKNLKVDMAFEDANGTPHRLLRTRFNDNMDVTLDERRVTQSDLTIMFGERDLFLSMFNPLYFIEVLGSKGRDLLERYLPELPHEQVMAACSEDTQHTLGGYDFLSAEAQLKKLRADIKDLKQNLVYIQGQADQAESAALERAGTLAEKQAVLQRLTTQISELETKRSAGFHGGDLKEKLADLYAQHEELLRESPAAPDTTDADTAIQKATAALEQLRAVAYQGACAQSIAETKALVDRLGQEYSRQKHILSGLKPGIQCPMCRQTITDATLPQVRKDFETSLKTLYHQGSEATTKLKDLHAQDESARAAFDSSRTAAISAGEAKLQKLIQRRRNTIDKSAQENELRTQKAAELRSEIQNLELDLECGMLTPEETDELKQTKESASKLRAEIEVLSAPRMDGPDHKQKYMASIKETDDLIAHKEKLITALTSYISKRVELTFSQLQMNRVAISLYEVSKGTGEFKDVFKFTYEGRPYVCISHSEKIRAGLEVTELIKRMVGVNYPVFIDDSESVPIIDNMRPSGQAFIAKVQKGAALQVQIYPNVTGTRAA